MNFKKLTTTSALTLFLLGIVSQPAHARLIFSTEHYIIGENYNATTEDFTLEFGDPAVGSESIKWNSVSGDFEVSDDIAIGSTTYQENGVTTTGTFDIAATGAVDIEGDNVFIRDTADPLTMAQFGDTGIYLQSHAGDDIWLLSGGEVEIRSTSPDRIRLAVGGSYLSVDDAPAGLTNGSLVTADNGRLELDSDDGVFVNYNSSSVPSGIFNDYVQLNAVNGSSLSLSSSGGGNLSVNGGSLNLGSNGGDINLSFGAGPAQLKIENPSSDNITITNQYGGNIRMNADGGFYIDPDGTGASNITLGTNNLFISDGPSLLSSTNDVLRLHSENAMLNIQGSSVLSGLQDIDLINNQGDITINPDDEVYLNPFDSSLEISDGGGAIGDIEILNDNGNLDLTMAVNETTDQTLSINASNTDATGGADISLSADDSIFLNPNASTLEISDGGTSGDIALITPSHFLINSFGDGVEINGALGVSIDGNGGVLNLESFNDVNVNSTANDVNVLASNSIFLNPNASTLEISDGGTSGDIQMMANDELNIFSLSDGINLEAPWGINIDGNGGVLNLESFNDVNVNSTNDGITLDAGDFIDLNADNDINIVPGSDGSGNLNITGPNNATINMGGTTSVQGSSGLLLDGGGNNISMIGTGNITANHGGNFDIDSGGSFNLDSNGINIDSTSHLTALTDDDVLLQMYANTANDEYVRLQAFNAGTGTGNVEIYANDVIDFSSPGDVVFDLGGEVSTTSSGVYTNTGSGIWDLDTTAVNIDSTGQLTALTDDDVLLQMYANTANDEYVRLQAFNIGTGTGNIELFANDLIEFSSPGDAVFDIGGQVGIKNTNPTYDLDVTGSTRITDNLGVGTTPSASYAIRASTTSSYGVWGEGAYAGGYFRDTNSGIYGRIGYDAYSIYGTGDGYLGGGNLGIGTTPIATSGILMRTNGASYSVGITQNAFGGASTMELTTTDGSGSSQASRIVLRGAANDPDMEFLTGAAGSESTMVLMRGTTRNVGIGDTNPSYRLEVGGGDVNTTGGGYRDSGSCVAGTCASDESLKKDITYLDSELEKILALKPARFSFIDEQYGSTENDNFGLIAQEVEEVYPDWVITDEDGYKNVRYGLNVEMSLLRSIQELKEEKDVEIEELKAAYQELLERLELGEQGQNNQN